MSTPRESAPSEEFAALHAQVRHYQCELTERDAVIAKHEAMIEHLQEQVRLLLAQRFAPSSEKIPDGQLGLFNEAEATAGEEPESAPATEVGAHRRGTPKRAPIPEAGVDPVPWTPQHCAEEVFPCRKLIRRTRRSTGARWSSWSVQGARQESWHASSGAALRRSAIGYVRAIETKGVVRTV